MKLIDFLRAKSERESENGKVLLVDHTKDTLLRVNQLRGFIDKNKNNIEYEKIKKDEFFEFLALALILHDLGKINYKFQQRVYEKEDQRWEQLKDFLEPIKDIDLRHEIISSIFASVLLQDEKVDGNTKLWFSKIRTAILLHHYNEYYINEKDLMEIIKSYEDSIKEYLKFILNNYDKFSEFLIDFLENLKNITENKVIDYISISNFKDRLESLLHKIEEKEDDISEFAEFYKIEENEEREWYDFFVFLGALRRCDYSASGDINVESIINLSAELYGDLSNKIKKIINQNKVLWQEKVLAKKDSNNLILIAPTGSGKTEFALLWAKNRGKKLIYTLPLRVALNDLYWRFGNKEKGYFDNNFLRILHSTAFLEYLKEEKEGKEVNIGAKQTSARLFSSPLSLTTPDQVFLTCLKYYGFDKIVSIYPLSAVVIDEIQAYDPEMAAIIIKTLKIIKELNSNILVITATFPPYFGSFLNEENGFKIIDLEKESKELKKEVKNYSKKRHKIRLIRDRSLFDYDQKSLVPLKEGFEEIKKLIKNNPNKNIMILVNNVGKAIEVYKLLTQYYKNSKNKENRDKENREWKEIQKLFEDLELNTVELLHSRIIEKEKTERIKRIKEKLKNGERVILVATQIVEASVDVDFDILITEISPIDSQIQRWGRIWRNRKGNYEENEPNIYIFTKIDKGTKAIYRPKEALEKTIEVLKEVENEIKDKNEALNYEKERELIEKVFEKRLENGNKLKDFYKEKIEKTLEWLKYYSAEKRSEAQRVFRNIAGIQVFVPNIPGENDEIYNALCKILKDQKNWKLPLISEERDSIVKLIKDKIKDGNLRQNEERLKWKILETLYNYSFNLPIYGFESNKIRNLSLERNLFKGFFILKSGTVDAREVKDLGIRNIMDIDIDLEEIKNIESEIYD